jgi:hypothetical protein
MSSDISNSVISSKCTNLKPSSNSLAEYKYYVSSLCGYLLKSRITQALLYLYLTLVAALELSTPRPDISS